MTSKRYQGNIITDNPTDPTANSGANYGVANGVWSLAEAKTFSAGGKWPIPASAPSAPTIGTATAGDASVSVAFTPGATGGLTPTYTATSNPGSITGTGSSSPVTVSGLTNGTAYTFTVTATNSAGTSAASSASNSATPEVPDTGLFFGGQRSNASPYSAFSNIQKVTITSTGNATGFGSLNSGGTYYTTSAASSSTRAVLGGGYISSSPYYINNLQYTEYSSSGSSSDFGDLTQARYWATGGGSSTRGIYWGGNLGPKSTVIDYITIASTGNATNFGSQPTNSYGMEKGASYANTTNYFYAGGDWGWSGSYIANRYYLTIASTGNASSYGSLSQSRRLIQAGANSTYGIVGGGTQASGVATIDRHTMSSSGTSTNFGSMSTNRSEYGAFANSTRVLFGGGANNPSGNTAEIQYVTIATTGNTSDFGDLATGGTMRLGGASNAHGGL